MLFARVFAAGQVNLNVTTQIELPFFVFLFSLSLIKTALVLLSSGQDGRECSSHRACGDILKNSRRILRQPLGSRRTNRMKPAPNSLGGAAFIFFFAFMCSKGANEISFTGKLLPPQQQQQQHQKTCTQFGGVAFSAVTRFCICTTDN